MLEGRATTLLLLWPLSVPPVSSSPSLLWWLQGKPEYSPLPLLLPFAPPDKIFSTSSPPLVSHWWWEEGGTIPFSYRRPSRRSFAVVAIVGAPGVLVRHLLHYGGCRVPRSLFFFFSPPDQISSTSFVFLVPWFGSSTSFSFLVSSSCFQVSNWICLIILVFIFIRVTVDLLAHATDLFMFIAWVNWWGRCLLILAMILVCFKVCFNSSSVAFSIKQLWAFSLQVPLDLCHLLCCKPSTRFENSALPLSSVSLGRRYGVGFNQRVFWAPLDVGTSCGLHRQASRQWQWYFAACAWIHRGRASMMQLGVRLCLTGWLCF